MIIAKRNFLLILFCAASWLAPPDCPAFDTRTYKITPPPFTMKQIEARIARNQNDASAYCDRAQANLTAGECEEAIVDYTHSLQLDRKLVRALMGRAQAYEMLGLDNKALLDVDALLATGDRQWYAEGVKLKLAILKSLKRFRECIPLYGLLLNSTDLGVGPRDRHELLELRAEMYLQTNQPTLSIADLDKALKLTNSHFFDYATMGKAYKMLGQSAKELDSYNKGIAMAEEMKARSVYPDRRIAVLYQLRADYYKNHGQPALAARDLAKTRGKAYEEAYEEIRLH